MDPNFDPRSNSAPLRRNDDDDDASVDSSLPSTLYVRSMATASRSLNARRLRQVAEKDVQFLQNRISKLKAEEDKARQEIDVTKKKTDSVLNNKQNFDATMSQRRVVRQQVDYTQRKEAALIALNRERQAKAVWAAKERVLMERREAVTNMRKQQEINECRVHICREEDRDKNLRQREAIRTMQNMTRSKREKELEARQESIRQEYEERILREEAERDRKERLAAQLVAQEAQLVYKLKRLHMDRQDALKKLATTVEATRLGAGSTTLPSLSRNSTYDEADQSM
eukprot:PhM_4_TR10835/c0_g1_i1/m.9507